ncbi:MAG: hypothetical protein ACYS7M_10715 [Planctomycetota bacterium]
MSDKYPWNVSDFRDVNALHALKWLTENFRTVKVTADGEGWWVVTAMVDIYHGHSAADDGLANTLLTTAEYAKKQLDKKPAAHRNGGDGPQRPAAQETDK